MSDPAAVCGCEESLALRARVAELEQKLAGACEACDGSGCYEVEVPDDTVDEADTVECNGCEGSGLGWMADTVRRVRQLEEEVDNAESVAEMAARDRDEAMVEADQLAKALQAIFRAGPSFPHRDLAKRALGIVDEPAPRSTAELRATLESP